MAQERKRAEGRERRRREALANYNEATYGARHPYASGFILVSVWMVAITLSSWVARELVGRPLDRVGTFAMSAAILAIYFVVYRARQG